MTVSDMRSKIVKNAILTQTTNIESYIREYLHVTGYSVKDVELVQKHIFINGGFELITWLRLKEETMIHDVDNTEIVRCTLCGKETTLQTHYFGSYYDEAYGIPKRQKIYGKVTACCHTEDFIEIEKGEDDA